MCAQYLNATGRRTMKLRTWHVSPLSRWLLFTRQKETIRRYGTRTSSPSWEWP